MAASVSQLNTLIPSGGVYEAVDLGLPSGTKWAKFNIGATSETDYGDLFAWGATEPYRMNDSTPIDNTNNYASSNANKIQHDLYPNEDAATVQWGKGWKMPTKAQFDELLANTTDEWTTISGINGRKFTASNGNYIFFPAAGYVGSGSLYFRGSYGIYWNRSFRSSSGAWRLGFYSSVRDVPLTATTGSVCVPCERKSQQAKHISMVVAGMIDYPFCYRGDISSYSDGNDIVNSGFYSEGSGVNNIPEWHHIVVFNMINGIIQLAVRDTGNSFLIRVKSWEGTWSDWKQLL